MSSDTTRLAVVAVAVAALAVAALGVRSVLRDDGPSSPVAEDGWSGRPILCGYREQVDELSELGGGEVLRLGDEGRALLRSARCGLHTGGRDGGGVPRLRGDRSHFVVATGSDRFDVRLVGVDVDESPPRLDVEHDVLGEGCGTTADDRGQLMLLVEAPAGAEQPSVSIREVPERC